MDESVEPLYELAQEAGLERQWRDVEGRDHVIPDERLATILAALGYRAANQRQARRSLSALRRARAQLPPLVVADAGDAIVLPQTCIRAEATGADGRTVTLRVENGIPRAPEAPGYYDFAVDGQAARLAVAPPVCPLPPGSGHRPWGAAVQVPSLRGSRDSAFGDFGALAEAIEVLAREGADAVAINPVHALFPGHGEGFSPYSPSSRRFFNGAMGDPALVGLPPLPEVPGGPLIEWESALPQRLAQLRGVFASLREGRRTAIEAMLAGDEALGRHAIFNALDCRFRPKGAKGWQDWPKRFRNPASAAVAKFATENPDEILFHAFVEWLAQESMATVQQRALAAGMRVGLVGDLAVGVDPGGSDCWSLGDAMLRGLSIGAPPDPLGPLGQNWSITSFSPDGLRRTGYAAWIAMIRAALANCGGLRIDHAFGLARLWVIPEGGGPADGAYLAYPFEDLVRLLTLEAHLAGAFIIAEDLGTSPHGFAAAIARRHMLGMRVLWFQRAEDHGFIGPQDYDRLAVAMSGTHDTPTVAGWWRGTDLDWAARLGRLPDGVDRQKAEEIRDWDRGLLWSTLAGHDPRPAPEDPLTVVDAAIAHIARTPCALTILPLEDLLGLREQPNLPGTVHEHPNWRLRLDGGLDDLLAGREHAISMLQRSELKGVVAP